MTDATLTVVTAPASQRPTGHRQRLTSAALRSANCAALALVALLAGVGGALADVSDWQVNEVLRSSGGNSAVRYIELTNPVGGCLFPTSQVRVYDAAGSQLDLVSPVTQTTCFGPDTYYLFATPAATTTFATGADSQMVPLLPATGQICFASSATRYDCVRWGEISGPVADLFAADDETSAPAPGDSQALARIATTHVVVDDWQILDPSPRGPNDGTPWSPPDAGPTPDAAPAPDARVGVDGAPPGDALPPPDGRVDAGSRRFLDVDPVGGAMCSCQLGRARAYPWSGSAITMLLLAAALGRRRRRGGTTDAESGQFR